MAPPRASPRSARVSPSQPPPPPPPASTTTAKLHLRPFTTRSTPGTPALQAGHKGDVPLVTRHYKSEAGQSAATFSHMWYTTVDRPTNSVLYHRLVMPCYAERLTQDPPRYRFEGSIAACEGDDLPRLPLTSTNQPPAVPATGPAPPRPAVIDFSFGRP